MYILSHHLKCIQINNYTDDIYIKTSNVNVNSHISFIQSQSSIMHCFVSEHKET